MKAEALIVILLIIIKAATFYSTIRLAEEL